MNRVLLLFISFVIGIAVSQPGATAQQPTPAAGVLQGRVLDGATDQPIARVSIGIDGRYRPTDDDGRFYFGGLPPGKQRLSATLIGYLSVGLQHPRPDQRTSYPDGIYVTIAPDKPTEVTIYMLYAPAI